MIDGTRKIHRRRRHRKDFTSIVYDTYKDFAENSSIHGLKYTIKSGIVIYEKIFWVFVIFGGLLGAGYMTVLFWSRYMSHPTRTSIATEYASTTAVPFPAVTICNINRIMANKVQKFIKRLLVMGTVNIDDDQLEIVERAFPQLLSLTNPERSYNMTELEVLQEVLRKNDYTDMRLIMRKVTQSCEELLIKCQWKFEPIDCEDIFEESLGVDGQCCSFNYLTTKKVGTPIRLPFNGYQSGLTVLLDPMIQEVQYASLYSTGVKVIIHYSSDYPDAGSIYKVVSAGRQTHLQVSASKIVCSADVKKLSIAQRECAYPDELQLSYFQSYADTNCLVECNHNQYVKNCSCVPFYYSFSDKPICNISHIPCMAQTQKKYVETTQETCNCPSQCEDFFYDVLSTTMKFETDNVLVTSSFWKNEPRLSKDSILLYVYFASQRQTILFRDTLTSTIYLLSSFGGVYSLFLGCSFITIVEIIYYCTLRFLVNLKILGKVVDKRPDLTTLQNHNQIRHISQNWVYGYDKNVFMN